MVRGMDKAFSRKEKKHNYKPTKDKILEAAIYILNFFFLSIVEVYVFHGITPRCINVQ